jgi:3-phosphoshikimate 1-carboxyvinyltransferase
MTSKLDNKTVLFIGLGMIGGSIALGLRRAYPDICIFACDSDESTRQDAVGKGIVKEAVSETDSEKFIEKADLIVIALPPLLCAEILNKIEVTASQDCVVCDVSSVKGYITKKAFGLSESFRRRLVPSHPIAGSEKSGLAFANPELLVGRNVVVTPFLDGDCAAVNLVNHLWMSLGANVYGMSAEKHDEVLAATSHLPHMLAYTTVKVLSDHGAHEDIFRYAAGGFADFTRLASSDPKMWADIFLSNSKAVREVLDMFVSQLLIWKDELSKLDMDDVATSDESLHLKLKDFFQEAKGVREVFLEAHYSPKDSQARSNTNVSLIAGPGGSVVGDLRVPGDKSISHRAVIFSSIADGVTKIKGFLQGEDSLRTVAAFREMGVTIIGPDHGELIIFGVGKFGLRKPRKALDMGNSGTAMRLLAGLLAAQPFTSVLTGDESLMQRPMNRIVEPLREMGAGIESGKSGVPPLNISGCELKGIDYNLPMASAQVQSCVLLAGIYASGETTVSEPQICRDHTERMLSGFGYDVQRTEGSRISLTGGGTLVATEIEVPADISSAAFFLVAAAITPDSDLYLRHVGINPTRTGILNLLEIMGASIELQNERVVGGEPVADIRVRYSVLRGIEIPVGQVPLAIDEFPVLFVAAACADGETVLTGAEELRVKESDRLAVMAEGLETIGVDLDLFPDGICIKGNSKMQFTGGEINSHGDHRIAMAFAVAGLRSLSEIEILDCSNVDTSFPNFAVMAQQVGLKLAML